MTEQKPIIDFAIGGQALLEGVMMRSPNHTVISVRAPDGKIIQQVEFYQNIIYRIKSLNIPLLRGIVNMFEMLFIGTKALNFSSQIAMEDETTEKKKNSEKKNKTTMGSQLAIYGSIVFGLGLALLLFKFLPLWLTGLVSGFLPALNENYLLFNLVDALLKTTIFIGYLVIMGMVPELKRVFRYHGAEHKSITTYERGLALTVENARGSSRYHPRCGTSFILLIFIISIVVFTLLPKAPDLLTNFSLRLLALPLIAGISYEILKYSAKKSSSLFFKIIATPGLLMQRLTTADPDDGMLEVALNSLKLALEAEKNYKKT